MTKSKNHTLHDILEWEVLPFVTKPGRYIGNEVNMIKKELSNVDIKFALVFPDVYEMGMSYMGFQILYHILNQLDFVAAERVYAPWIDMEERMRHKGVPLFTLESKLAVKEYDIIGFTLQYELHYSNIVNLLDLAGMPVEAKNRDQFPIVIGGGPCVFNPEPLVDFFDAFVIGDAEELAVEIVSVVRAAKQKGLNRFETLRELSKLYGVYVPEFYTAEYSDKGRFKGLTPVDSDVPDVVQARVVDELEPKYYTNRPLVPMVETTHDRISLEIARGCTRGCRFCNAGFIYRPVRERPVRELVNQAQNSLANTGYDEVSLVSLSTSDYCQLPSLMESLRNAFKDSMVSLSFPSLRPEKFTPEVARFAKGVRKSGLTLAPEAGTARLRDVINKTTTNEDLLTAADLAFRQGWKLIKLYFMIGLPSETEEDLEGIVGLIKQVAEIGRLHHGGRVNVSISPFVPKAHTPFQWVEQVSVEEMRRRIDYLCGRIRNKNVKISWRQVNVANLEGVMARGDRRLGKVIKRAWELGAKFDAWTEKFKASVWDLAFAECGMVMEDFTKEITFDEPLPWDHINKGVQKKYLTREYFNSVQGTITFDCKDDQCNACGLMREKACQDIISGKKKLEPQTPMISPIASDSQYGRGRKRAPQAHTDQPKMARIKYRKGQQVRFLSHLDMIRLLERAFRRAGVPLAYTEGFNPHPKIAYGPPLATGFTSDAEYLDLQYRRETKVDIGKAVASALPNGVELLEIKALYGKGMALNALINRADYEIRFPRSCKLGHFSGTITKLLGEQKIIVERVKGDTIRTVDIRPFIRDVKYVEQVLHIATKLNNGQTVRIEEILGLLFDVDDSKIKQARIIRSGLWVQYGEILASPMEM